MNLKNSALNFFVLLGIMSLLLENSLAQSYNKPFYPNQEYDKNVPHPEQVLGLKIGERPLRYNEVIQYLNVLAQSSSRVKIWESGETFEGRKLIYVIISSEENLSSLKEIKENIGKLADPRTLDSGSLVGSIIDNTPAIAWMMYGIHGDELSSTDAGVFLSYQLAAGMDSISQKLLKELVIGIDPMENPDGRERFLGQMQQWNGLIPNSDIQSMQHYGFWTVGRGNHYLFDLNRDWFILENPESRARVKAIREWRPQLVIDSHEMGSLSTYLFPPAREPINTNVSENLKQWNNIFAKDQAKAFDTYGWSYYTREWHENWYPGYGSNMPNFDGAIGILYEQASTDGSLVKRQDGTILTFRESVHHHFVSSMANLNTLANHRKQILSDFYNHHKIALSNTKNTLPKAYLLIPGENKSRISRFINKLLLQKIEIYSAQKEFKIEQVISYWDKKKSSKSFPKGTIIIPMNQPLSPLINAVLEFDPRTSTKFLEEERKSLLKENDTKLYEVSAWSMPMAYGLDVYAAWNTVKVNSQKITEPPVHQAMMENSEPVYGYFWSNSDDNSYKVLIQLLEKGYKIRCSKKPTYIDKKFFHRGGFLIRKIENPELKAADIEEISQAFDIDIYGTNTALSLEGSDLGGEDFVLLDLPRIALLTGHSISTTSFSALWYLLDREFQIKHSLLDYHGINRFDLRKYNVLLLPSTWGGKETYSQLFGKENIQKLKNWVENGGTLIAIGNGAAFLADSTTGMSEVALRQQVLNNLALYQNAYEMDLKNIEIMVDSTAIWDKATLSGHMSAPQEKKDGEQLKMRDEFLRTFQPRGAILTANLDQEHWLNFGIGDKIPVIFYSPYAYMAKSPVQTTARLADSENLRLSGILWPEARTRWKNTAFVTRESVEKGQIILFAGEPFFRAYFHGSGRMLINALLLGPGFGTSSEIPW
jgi:hypothetical protein